MPLTIAILASVIQEAASTQAEETPLESSVANTKSGCESRQRYKIHCEWGGEDARIRLGEKTPANSTAVAAGIGGAEGRARDRLRSRMRGGLRHLRLSWPE